MDRRDRQEGRTSGISVLKQLNGALSVLFRADNNILHGAAERDLNCNRIAVFRPEQARNRTVNVLKSADFFLLHHKANGFGEPLIVPLHLEQKISL